MTARRLAVGLALLGLACAEPDPPILLEDCTSYTCLNQRETASSFLTLHRGWGPDADASTWRFVLDERQCTLTPVVASSAGESARVTVVCSLRGEADDGTIPLFVGAAMVAGGFGRVFRLETMARALSHVRVEREGVVVAEFDHAPQLTKTPECPLFAADFGSERELPDPGAP